MPVRTLNFTRRKRIERKHALITVHEDHNGPFFDAMLDLSSYGLPDEARVFVEAFRQTTYMRFDFGRIGDLRAPSKRFLTEFDTAEGIQFRVKVVATEPRGLLLAQADGIRPRQAKEEKDERVPLISVVPEELGHEIWRLEFDEREPMLKVNTLVGNYRDIVRDPVFVALVLPAVLRDILWRILIYHDHRDVSDMEDWRSRWLTFASLLPGVGPPPEDETSDQDALEEWIERAVASFCRKHTIRQKFTHYRGDDA